MCVLNTAASNCVSHSFTDLQTFSLKIFKSLFMLLELFTCTKPSHHPKIDSKKNLRIVCSHQCNFPSISILSGRFCWGFATWVRGIFTLNIWWSCWGLIQHKAGMKNCVRQHVRGLLEFGNKSKLSAWCWHPCNIYELNGLIGKYCIWNHRFYLESLARICISSWLFVTVVLTCLL